MTDQNKAVFLSYASQDAETARNLSDALRAANIEVWFDQSELRGGDAWDQKIRQKIGSCALFVPIISAHTQARAEGYFRLEWKLAVDRSHLMVAEKLFLLPVVVDATTESEALVPAQFRIVQWTRIRTGESPAAFVNHIAALLNRPITTHIGNPEYGVSRTSSRRSSAPVLAVSFAAISALVIAIAIRGGWLSPKPAPNVDAIAASALMAIAPAAISEKSVAVLPFVDMSQKKDQEYFSDGLSEELIDLLSRVPDLHVPARTSSFYFKGKAAKIAEIGKELSVAHVLEGSVRKSGNMVRVTVQLIRVDSGFLVWSETFDRPLSDIFKVQDQIANLVVSSLKISLLKGAAPTISGTNNPEAHDLYLHAKSMVRTLSAYDSKEQLEKVVEYLHRTLELDPAYVDALTFLSQILSDQSLYGYKSGAPIRDAAHDAAAKAIAIAPNSSDSHTAMARIYMLLDRDWAAALSQVRQALVLDLNNSWALVCEGMIYVYGGRPDLGIPQLERSVSIDPINESRYVDLAVAYHTAGRYADAVKAYRNVLDLEPSARGVHSALAEALLANDGAAAALVENAKESDPEAREAGEAVIYYALGRKSDSDKALADLEKKYGDPAACDIARILAYRGEVEDAFKWLGRVRQPQCVLAKADPFFKTLRPDPRFKAFLNNIRLPE